MLGEAAELVAAAVAVAGEGEGRYREVAGRRTLPHPATEQVGGLPCRPLLSAVSRVAALRAAWPADSAAQPGPALGRRGGVGQEGWGLDEPTPFSLDPSEGPREALRLLGGYLPKRPWVNRALLVHNLGRSDSFSPCSHGVC